MRHAVWALAALLALGGSAAVVFANIGPPVRPNPGPKPAPAVPTVPFVVLVDDKVKEPHLEIPRTLVVAMRASADEAETETRRAEAPRLHLILAGTALSLSLAAGGFWLLRSGNRFSRSGAALLLAVGVLLTLGAASLFADLGPRPAGPRPPLPNPPLPVLPPGIAFDDGVVLDIVPKGTAIRLIVPSKQLQDVLDKSTPKPDAKPGVKPGLQPRP
jgi:hypothetical protein